MSEGSSSLMKPGHQGGLESFLPSGSSEYQKVRLTWQPIKINCDRLSHINSNVNMAGMLRTLNY